MTGVNQLLFTACLVAIGVIFFVPPGLVAGITSTGMFEMLCNLIPVIDVASAWSPSRERCALLWATQWVLAPVYYYQLMLQSGPWNKESAQRVRNIVGALSRFQCMLLLAALVGFSFFVVGGDWRIIDVPSLVKGSPFLAADDLHRDTTIMRWMKETWMGNAVAAIGFPFFTATIYFAISFYFLYTVPLLVRRVTTSGPL